MPRRTKIAEARAKPAELAKYLVRHPDAGVLVEHPFELAGSITTGLGDDELEAVLREMTGWSFPADLTLEIAIRAAEGDVVARAHFGRHIVARHAGIQGENETR